MSEAIAEDTGSALRRMLAVGNFQRLMGLELVSFDASVGQIELHLPWQDDFERSPGSRQWHGGPIAALIDIAGDFALIAKMGRGIPTIDLRIDFLRPAIATDLWAVARVLRSGRSIGVVDIEVRNADRRPCALGRGTYSTLPPSV